MRHRKSGRGFGRNSAQRLSLFRNLVGSLVEHGRLRTTEAKAKELRRYAEKAITIARNAPSEAFIATLEGDEALRARARRVASIRRARRLVHTDAVVTTLFSDVGPRYVGRPGGYTRVVKAGFRQGDNAPMAIIELVSDHDASRRAAAQEE